MSTFSASPFGSPMAQLYLPFDRGMQPAIDHTVGAVREVAPGARAILDLGSGPGEPACSLAQALPEAAVICSDVAQAMVELAKERAQSKGLSNLSTMILDLADLSAIPAASKDVVTANFAIMSLPDLQAALAEMHRVLKPGGLLAGTVWQTFSVPVLSRAVMTDLLGSPPAPPAIDPMRLADAALLDGELAAAGFRTLPGHNAIHEITFDLGPVAGDTAWKSVLISGLGALEQMEAAGDATVRDRARATVEKLATAHGFIKDGMLLCPGTFRAFRLTKPAA